MSRSTKKPIVKDSNRNFKKSTIYWRQIRRVTKQFVRKLNKENTDSINIPQPKEIVNDYDYCDYIIDYRDNWAGEEYTKKISRK